MSEVFSSPFFGISLSVVTYWFGVFLQKKTRLPVCNPLVIAILLTMGCLMLFDIPYESYDAGGSIINMFLAPVTVCLGVSVYLEIKTLKQYAIPILVGCGAGSAASMASVYLLCRLFRLDDALTMALIPKSVTTPIALSISEGHGGVASVTVLAVVFTGILGSIFAPVLLRMFRVSEPVAAGLAIGACSHAVGTSKALEIGKVEGAMSGLAIGICGMITVLFSLLI